jgi:peptidoglycan hydrolase-like protein with peptidoglycan-binding domain
MRGVQSLFVVLLGIAVAVLPGWAGDAALQEAQQQLSHLGYDPGTADGVYGPRTRQALEAFQRARNLPVTGQLDTATLQELSQAGASAGTATAETEASVPVRSPLHVVVDYLRFQAIQPGRALQYTTEDFRHGLPPQEWLAQVQQARQEQGETYVGWKVQRLHVADTQAIVYVQTRMLRHGQEHTRYEVFTLVRTPEGEWLLDGWRLEAFPPDRQPSRTGS